MSINAVSWTLKAPFGFVVPIPIEPNEAVAVWKSTSQSGVAEVNPTEPVKLTWLNVEIPDVVNRFVPSITLPNANKPWLIAIY